ncbi:MAG: hypothetical protein M1457_10580 [bacterium]|nr:hypothetical protein [bacterium]
MNTLLAIARILPALVLAAVFGAGGSRVARAQTSQSATHVLLRTSFTSGLNAEARLATGRCTLAEPVASVAAAPAANLFAGFLAPPVDPFGLITVGRLAGYLVGASADLGAVAADYAGNEDGRIDVGDLIAFIDKYDIR